MGNLHQLCGVQALASLFIAHMSRKPVIDRFELRDAGYFFTRPADVLQVEVEEVLKKNNRFGPREEMRKKYRQNPIPRPGSVPDCACPSLNTPSIDSVYSSFISHSSSASTLPTIAVKEQVTPRLDEALWQLVTQALNNALNNMYVAREHELYYDEAYLCLMGCMQKAVETVWGPKIQEITGIIDSIIDDVRRITSEKRRLKLLMTDKLPSKVNRLKTDFKGYEENPDYPDLKKKEILETLKSRQGTYNRYPKDKFGVYLPTCDKSLDVSVTYVPPGCDEEEESLNKTDDELPLDDNE
ncbi:uncharacterized protein LOC114363307 isoform X1 [Ostrinia furnacalis]|uniref:uncharacterized protein LOC114363307 isoform X1 n=1 Tax=Ostrinia furnacalis TaxID=93504 RepID=UPI00103A31C2|nr:uncharacterized protein LOC114363307 isoform X1 [Ostrinia furnacalis]